MLAFCVCALGVTYAAMCYVCTVCVFLCTHECMCEQMCWMDTCSGSRGFLGFILEGTRVWVWGQAPCRWAGRQGFFSKP